MNNKSIKFVLVVILSILFNITNVFAKDYECLATRTKKTDNTCNYNYKDKYKLKYTFEAYNKNDSSYKAMLNFNSDDGFNFEHDYEIENNVVKKSHSETKKVDGKEIKLYYNTAFDMLQYEEDVCPDTISICKGTLVKVEKQGLLLNLIGEFPEVVLGILTLGTSYDGKLQNNFIEALVNKLGASEVKEELYVGMGSASRYYDVGDLPQEAYDKYGFDKENPLGIGEEDWKWKKHEDWVDREVTVPVLGDLKNAIGGGFQHLLNATVVSSSWGAYDVQCDTISLSQEQRESQKDAEERNKRKKTYAASCSYLDNSLEKLKNCLKTYSKTQTVDGVKNQGCDNSKCKSQIGTEIYNIDYNVRNECKDILSTFSYKNVGEEVCIDRCVNLDNEIAKLYEDNHYYGNNKVKCSLSSNIINFANNILNWFKYIAPVLVIILGILDFLKALVSQDNDAMKKAQGKFVRRLVAAVLLFIIPILIDYVLNVFNLLDSNCGATNLFK